MPELNFKISGVEAATRGLVPLMLFKLQVNAANSTESIQGLLLNAQIQIQSPQRVYSSSEKERLVDLFGAPERWGQTLRNRLWTHANCTLGAFTGAAETVITVPCTFDLNIAATKYFYALDEGEVPLLFLFSGSAFYLSAEGKLQVERISWDKECTYRMAVKCWKDLMEEHYPNCAWLYLKRDVFDRLYKYRRQNGLATWEQTIEALLNESDKTEREVSSGRQREEVPA
jgi:Family of unknown function (DUF6084)